jgi:hypothetical protein
MLLAGKMKRMKPTVNPIRNAHRPAVARRGILVVLLSVCVWQLGQPAQAKAGQSGAIPAADFAAMVRNFSEAGGDFASDNYISNELAYMNIMGRLKEVAGSGGAYVGVGPEQNFTYIANIRPRIVFIVDIRRQAVIQHLMYKAIFHLSKNRAEFLSLLFSRPLPKKHPPKGAPIRELIPLISEAAAPSEVFSANLALIRNSIEQTFRIPLSAEDTKSLETTYTAFWKEGIDIRFHFGHSLNLPGTFGFPSLRELVLATDANGKGGHFLADERDYEFVRKLQEQNRVIPIVGDFAGVKALRTVGDYLRENRYTVTAFYVSNVEEYLYENQGFGRFVENVGRLPVSDKSVIIRAVRSAWTPHSHWSPRDNITMFLQSIPVFLRNYSQGLIPTYGRMVNTDFIAGEQPNVQELLPAVQ